MYLYVVFYQNLVSENSDDVGSLADENSIIRLVAANPISNDFKRMFCFEKKNNLDDFQ